MVRNSSHSHAPAVGTRFCVIPKERHLDYHNAAAGISRRIPHSDTYSAVNMSTYSPRSNPLFICLVVALFFLSPRLLRPFPAPISSPHAGVIKGQWNRVYMALGLPISAGESYPITVSTQQRHFTTKLDLDHEGRRGTDSGQRVPLFLGDDASERQTLAVHQVLHALQAGNRLDKSVGRWAGRRPSSRAMTVRVQKDELGQ